MVKQFLFLLFCCPVLTEVKPVIDDCLQKQLPPVIFTKNSSTLSKENKKTLDTIIVNMSGCKDYTLVVEMHNTYHNQKWAKTSWDRTNNLFTYLLSRGLDSNRVAANYTGNIYSDTIRFYIDSFSVTKEEPPHPNSKK